MALIPCKECFCKISTEAKSCPMCGAKPPSKPVNVWLVIVVSTLSTALIYWFKHLPEPVLTPEQQLQQAASRAAYQCEYYIEHSLNDPDSAEFDEISIRITTEVTGKNDSGRWAVTLPLRAKNRFNALVYGVYFCRVSKNEEGKWQILNLNQIN